MAAEIFDVLIVPVGGEEARLEVGELSATGTTVGVYWWNTFYFEIIYTRK